MSAEYRLIIIHFLLIYKGWDKIINASLLTILWVIIWGANKDIVAAADLELTNVQVSVWEAAGTKVTPVVCNICPCDLLNVTKQVLMVYCCCLNSKGKQFGIRGIQGMNTNSPLPHCQYGTLHSVSLRKNLFSTFCLQYNVLYKQSNKPHFSNTCICTY